MKTNETKLVVGELVYRTLTLVAEVVVLLVTCEVVYDVAKILLGY